MSEHHVAVTIQAPVHQVYQLFTHFNDFPKFMHFVKEVTYYDDQRSHWVAQVAGQHEWDAVNEHWVPDQQIGWRSTSGLENTGRVKFLPLTDQQTNVDVYISYTPPVGVVGEVADRMGIDSRFDATLQEDLNNFARMVEQAPSDALDSMSSHYLFHENSAFVGGTVTQRQREAMSNDTAMSVDALQQRDAIIQQRVAGEQQAEQQHKQERQQREQQLNEVVERQQAALHQQAEADRQVAQQRVEEEQQDQPALGTAHPVYDTLGGRNAAQYRTAIGDQDARSERFPQHHEDPMTARHPGADPTLPQTELQSPWRNAIHGETAEAEQERHQAAQQDDE